MLGSTTKSHVRELGRIDRFPLCLHGIMDGRWDWVLGNEVTIGELDLARHTALDCLASSPGAFDWVG